MLVVVLLLASTQATAQKVYKCKDADGSTIYQQVQCSDQDGEVVKLQSQPSQARIAEAQARFYAQEEQRMYEQSMQAATQVIEYYEPAPTAKRSRRQSSQAAPSFTSPSSLSSEAVNPSRFDPERVGFSRTRGYEPLRHRSSPNPNTTATRVGPGYTEPTRVQDQHGNGYIRPPGSHFVTDEKTGRQCLAVGGTIRCN